MKNNNQPVAIVGMACRFPGGCDTPEQFWTLLREGMDVITEVRSDRWSRDYYYHPDPKASGKTYTTAAGQLENIYDFDPGFFGISPREAAQMDPQQRLLLQMTWEALEDAAELPQKLAGSHCSVFTGVSSLDYANNRMDDPNVADAYFMTGNTLSIAANRISYYFDLHGPSMTIDTACSSSLVALHQACSSIWAGESTSSIVGAVHLVLSPFPFIGFSKASMLSRLGRCSVFDASADGYVRSEGGVVLYLKPLDQALQDNNTIHAIIRGTAVNSDGNTSAMTVPNGAAQASLLHNLYANTGIDINDIDYIEAHGTGTPVGDPIEAGALGQAIGTKRSPDRPLLIGSVKTNVGHLEPASGFAGLLKVVLSLKHGTIPATIHQHSPNPLIDFKDLNLQVVKSITGLDAPGRPLIMGVNSFGFGGTNAHAILEQYREPPEQMVGRAGTLPPLFLSAMSESSLRKRAAQFHQLLDQPLSDLQTYSILHTAACRRQRLKLGLVVAGDNTGSIRQALVDYIDGHKSPHVVRIDSPLQTPTAWIFSGNGCQWQGMGKTLLADDVFRSKIHEIDSLFSPLSGWSLIDEMQASAVESRITMTEIAQPLLFAVQAGIAGMMQEAGLRPDIVAGHSVGEIAAAYIAGCLTLQDAVRVIYFRSMAQGKTRGTGRMAVIRLSAEQITPLLKEFGDAIVIAAFNASDSVTISGDAGSIKSLIERLQAQAVTCRELDLDYAFHSSKMDQIEPSIHGNLDHIRPVAGTTGFVSTVTGSKFEGAKLDANYWWQNIRQPVRFQSAIENICNQGIFTFVEIGSHPVLQSYIRETAQACGGPVSVLKTVKRNDTNERLSVQSTAYKLLFSDPDSSLSRLFTVPARPVSLPSYPWENSAYLFNGSNEAINRKLEHPLLGYRLNSVDGIWTQQIDLSTHPYLADHIVDGVVIFPAAGYVEMALAASRNLSGWDGGMISNLEIRKPLLLEPGKTKTVQFHLAIRDMQFSVRSRDRLSNVSWTEHATGRIGQVSSSGSLRLFDVQKFLNGPLLEAEQIYATASEYGLEYGPAFRGAVQICMDGNSVLSRLQLPGPALLHGNSCLWHPVLLDSAFHSLFALLSARTGEPEDRSPYIPVEMNDLRYQGRGSENMAYSECTLNRAGPGLIQASFVFYDHDGLEVASIRNCLFRKLPRQDRSNSQPARYSYSLVPKNLINPYALTSLPPMNRILDAVVQMDGRDVLIAEEAVRSEQIIPLLDALASAISEQTLRDYGAHLGYFTLDSLLGASRIPENFTPLISRMLDILEQDGKAVRRRDEWKLHDSEEPDDPAAIWRSILADFPSMIDTLRQLSGHAMRIRDHLQEQQLPDPALICLPASTNLQKGLLKYLMEQIIQSWPVSGRRLRIAEIRCRPVATPGTCLPELPSAFCDYEILATSNAAAEQAEELYRHNACISVTRIDMSVADLQPRYHQGEFDMVLILGEIAHCGPVTEVFAGIQWLLASGGMLVALDRRPDRISDLNAAILEPEKWYRTGQNGKPVPVSLHPEDWINILENSGFEEIYNLADMLCEQTSRYLLTARRPLRQVTEPGKANNDLNVLLVSSADGLSFDLARTFRDKLLQAGVRTLMAVDAEGRVSGRNITALQLKEKDLATQLAGSIDPHNTLPLNIFYFGGLNDKPGEADSADTAIQVTKGNMKLLNLIRSLSDMELKTKPTIRIVTSGAAAGYHETGEAVESNPYQAGLWALGRVIRNEYPDMDCRLMDLQQISSIRQAARLLLQEMVSGDGEEELVFINSARMALRLDSLDVNAIRATVNGEANDGCHLAFKRAGSIDNIHWSHTNRRLPDVDQIEIEVKATGLNFRDIMFTSGLLPPEMLEGGHSGATLGLECSGVVTRLGPFVTGYNIGDEVIAMAPACFASHVIASRHSVMKKPAGWSFEAAATVPTAFFTVYYSLHHMARLRKGERILIHGATGAVGLAAIQYARYCGAEIFATAGSVEKRQFLAQLGVEHVLNSRTLDFADDILSITHGQGVDVILNTLAGEAMLRNFSVLRPFGRFIELGKRDFFENTKLDLKPFRNNIAYYGVDADQLLSHEPELSARLMSEVFELFGEGVFRPLPYSRFDAANVQDAFRYMQQSRHIGKIVVCNSGDKLKIRHEHRKAELELDPSGTYLITGGTGGLGLATARWLVEKGARHLILVGRNGLKSDLDAAIIQDMIARHVDVRSVQCDVTDAIRLQSLLNEIQQSDYPLKGIIHSAMVLEDSSIRNMDEERMYAVIAPKVQGAWNLHRLTLNLELDMFVLYSSATTCLGNPGQANYVAANAFLEALARMREHEGLPATVICWDAITDTGYLARNEHLAGRLSRKLGLGGINSRQAMDTLEQELLEGRTETIVMNASWSSLRQILPVLNSNLFRNIMHDAGSDTEMGGEDILDLLTGLSQKEKQPLIVSFLMREIARILQTSEEKIAHNSTIQDLGVDSLMAMELANTIETRLGINLPVITLADNITIDNLALRIIELLGPQTGTPDNAMTDIVGSLARIHAEDMTSEQIASLSRSVNTSGRKTVRLIQ